MYPTTAEVLILALAYGWATRDISDRNLSQFEIETEQGKTD